MTSDNHHSNGLIESQRALMIPFRKIQKTLNNQLLSSVYVVGTFILVIFFLLLMDGLEAPFEIIFITLNTSVLVGVALNNIRIVWPHWKDLDGRLKQIKEKSSVTGMRGYDGITNYVNRMQSMLYNQREGILKSSVDHAHSTPRFFYTKGWALQVIIGIAILLINLGILFLFVDPQTFDTVLWLSIAYIGVLMSYGGMIFHGKKVRDVFLRWNKVFDELERWGSDIELLPTDESLIGAD
ncbi:MAG: hypothetical protein ACFFE8_09625 [Candidatus Heimdallarchaeota archaeon]